MLRIGAPPARLIEVAGLPANVDPTKLQVNVVNNDVELKLPIALGNVSFTLKATASLQTVVIALSQAALLEHFATRPAVGYADFRSPIDGLYQASSATHAGGGVTGLPGSHCVREIIKDKKAKRKR